MDISGSSVVCAGQEYIAVSWTVNFMSIFNFSISFIYAHKGYFKWRIIITPYINDACGSGRFTYSGADCEVSCYEILMQRNIFLTLIASRNTDNHFFTFFGKETSLIRSTIVRANIMTKRQIHNRRLTLRFGKIRYFPCRDAYIITLQSATAHSKLRSSGNTIIWHRAVTPYNNTAIAHYSNFICRAIIASTHYTKYVSAMRAI